jgi:hypothetical protein
LFAGNHTVISASWGLNYFADSVAILDNNWTTGQLGISSQGVTVFEQTITSRGKNTIIKLPGLYMIGSLTLELQSIAQLRIGILFVGKRIELPLFNTGFKYKLNVLGKGGRTRYGIV